MNNNGDVYEPYSGEEIRAKKRRTEKVMITIWAVVLVIMVTMAVIVMAVKAHAQTPTKPATEGGVTVGAAHNLTDSEKVQVMKLQAQALQAQITQQKAQQDFQQAVKQSQQAQEDFVKLQVTMCGEQGLLDGSGNDWKCVNKPPAQAPPASRK